jgi:hypothetical protein
MQEQAGLAPCTNLAGLYMHVADVKPEGISESLLEFDSTGIMHGCTLIRTLMGSSNFSIFRWSGYLNCS